MKFFPLLAITTLILGGCSAKATGTASAREIFSGFSGYRCFAILNGDGDTVGGNCVKE